jgi:cell division transport system permease protein
LIQASEHANVEKNLKIRLINKPSRFSFSNFVAQFMQTEAPKNSNRRLRSSYISAILSISLVLLMLGLLGLLVLDAKKISDYVKEHVELNVYLNDGIASADIKRFQKNIEQKPYAKSVVYISKQQALDSLMKELGEGALGMLESNPLPATIDIRVNSAYSNPDSLKKIHDELASSNLAREVTYQQTEVDKMNENFKAIAMVILVFCALLFFIAVALINNTIRLSMYSRRFLIKSMQLVGATRAFIRWPFLKRGILHGIYAGIIAGILLSGIIYVIHTRFPELGQLSDMRMLGILVGGVLVLGLLLSFISTFFAVNRYLRLKTDELY